MSLEVTTPTVVSRQLKIEDLKPGDLIVSYKKPGRWNLLQKFFDWCLKRYAISVYGPQCAIPHANHIRTVVGKIFDTYYCFHWSDPAARYQIMEPWMIEPGYCLRVCRPKVKKPSTANMFLFFMPFDGTLYDALDLGGMLLRITHFFHGLGSRNFVCSTGARHAQEKRVFYHTLDQRVKTADTPPCFPAQYDHLYDTLPFYTTEQPQIEDSMKTGTNVAAQLEDSPLDTPEEV